MNLVTYNIQKLKKYLTGKGEEGEGEEEEAGDEKNLIYSYN